MYRHEDNHFTEAAASSLYQLISAAEKFTAMDIRARKDVEKPKQVEKTPRREKTSNKTNRLVPICRVAATKK